VKRRIWLLRCSLLAAIAALFFIWYQKGSDPVVLGKNINREAWELSFVERGVPIPPSGPREGYWGSRLGAKVPHPRLGWREPSLSVPGLLEIDSSGLQHFRGTRRNKSKVIIFGGSVAFGAYASEIAKSYFHVLGGELERQAAATDVTIVAAGAWKSIQELNALELYGPTLRPDLVIFLNGLNDLTNGATSDTLYGQSVATADGSKWSPLYHAHDYRRRTAAYLENMGRAALVAARLGSDILFVLQPSLGERARRTRMESLLLEGALEPHASLDALKESYAAMRIGLRGYARPASVHFVDCSRIFDQERATTFSDIWHFSDFGHAILGRTMARHAARILGTRLERQAQLVR
jgi:GDSL-like Lipase/Acylhydrolase family